MQIKHLFLTIILFVSFNNLFAFESNSEAISENDRSITFYAGINPLSLAAFLPNPIGIYGTGYGILSNQEYGISIYGGMHFHKAHSLEMRCSTGPAGNVIWDTQLQLGYVWYPLEQFLDRNGGLNIGFFMRQFFWNNNITDYVIFNLTPEIKLGWRFKVKALAFDLRTGWNIASVTWSNMPDTKAAAGWTQFPLNLTLTTGISWIFN